MGSTETNIVPPERGGRQENRAIELLRMDIIEKVEGPTPWVNPVIVVPKAKDTDIRLCLDMRMANRAIIRGRYPILTIDELLHDMNGSVLFSKLDLKMGLPPD